MGISINIYLELLTPIEPDHAMKIRMSLEKFQIANNKLLSQ